MHRGQRGQRHVIDQIFNELLRRIAPLEPNTECAWPHDTSGYGLMWQRPRTATRQPRLEVDERKDTQ